jgi:hypothetical protein
LAVPRSQSILLCLIFAGFASFGCGANDHVQLGPDDDGQIRLQINPTLNECPTFTQSLVIPQAIPPRFSAEVVVIATDPDGPNSAIEYTWSASSGSFTDLKQPFTRYGCEARGLQLLKLDAVDARGCTSRLALAVDCLDE